MSLLVPNKKIVDLLTTISLIERYISLCYNNVTRLTYFVAVIQRAL